MANTDSRRQLALEMVTTLPRWGSWAASMRDVDTQFGRIGYRQASIMWLLRKGNVPPEQRTTTGIAAIMRVQNSVITRAGEHLEHLGLIERTVSSDDRRRYFLSLTAAGTDASIYIEDLYVKSIGNAMADLDDETIEDIGRTLTTLDEILTRLTSQPLGS